MDDVVGYYDDCLRIQKVMFEHGMHLTLKEANDVWSHYSEQCAASWLGLPESDLELKEIIKGIIKELESRYE